MELQVLAGGWRATTENLLTSGEKYLHGLLLREGRGRTDTSKGRGDDNTNTKMMTISVKGQQSSTGHQAKHMREAITFRSLALTILCLLVWDLVWQQMQALHPYNNDHNQHHAPGDQAISAAGAHSRQLFKEVR